MSLRRETLSRTYIEGALWAVMVATAENYALYFAVKRGMTATEVALITTVPVLLGAFMNWLSPLLVSTATLKRGVLSCIGLQVLGLLGLVFSVESEHYFAFTFLSLTLYWMGGMGASPLWMDWVSGWIPKERFGRFYSRRSSFLSFITMIFFVGAGYFLHRMNSLKAFYIVFGTAFLARFISFAFLSRQESPRWKPQQLQELDESRPKIWSWRLLFSVISFAALFKFVANIGSPFFLPYLVNNLKLNVFEISIVNGMSFLGLSLLTASFGEALKTFHAITGLQISMLLAALNCFLWTFFTDIYAISALQLFSGINWTVFDLSCILIIQANFPHSARRILGLQMAMASVATILGSLVGSRLLNSGYSSLELFQISAAARFLVAFVFIGFFFRSKDVGVSLKTYQNFLKAAFAIRLPFIK